SAYLDRAQIAMRQSRFSAAESDLLSVIASYPDNFLALEQLAVVYQRQRRLPEAAMVLENARQAVPYRRCAFSANLAVVQVLGGRREQAREILESARELVGSELNAVCPLVLFHLGTLYLEDGETEKARQAYRDYLDVTARATDQENLSRREIALQRVN
ncbi:MAG: tetratricopeptide repeat protein, partial [Acidobacteriota bacterium]